MGHALHAADWRWLAIGWVVYGVVELLATMRWQILLRVQGITARMAARRCDRGDRFVFQHGAAGTGGRRCGAITSRLQDGATAEDASDAFGGDGSFARVVLALVPGGTGGGAAAKLAEAISGNGEGDLCRARAAGGRFAFHASFVRRDRIPTETETVATCAISKADRGNEQRSAFVSSAPGSGRVRVRADNFFASRLLPELLQRDAIAGRTRGACGKRDRCCFDHAIGEHDHGRAGFLRRSRRARNAVPNVVRQTGRCASRGRGTKRFPGLLDPGVVGRGWRIGVFADVQTCETEKGKANAIDATVGMGLAW